jgi:hypothetical protein
MCVVFLVHLRMYPIACMRMRVSACVCLTSLIRGWLAQEEQRDIFKE